MIWGVTWGDAGDLGGYLGDLGTDVIRGDVGDLGGYLG